MLKHQAQPAKNRFRVFLVDDHPIVRQGLAELINREKDLIVCGEAETVADTLHAIDRDKPDIVVVDLSLKGADGIELIKQIRGRQNAVPVLVLSMHDESLYAERSLRAGARGYIMKQEATEKVLLAMRRVIDGEIYVSDRIEKRMLQKFIAGTTIRTASPMERLTDRELEVFRLIGQGHGTRQIAEELCLSVKTVESYRAHLKEKLMLKSASELVQHAVQWIERETKR